MGKWATIQGRQMLHNFPCVPEGCDSNRVEIHFCASGLTPDCEIEDVCPLRPIYEEYMRLRDVVATIIGESLPKHEALACLEIASDIEDYDPGEAEKWRKLEKAWMMLT